MSEPTESPASTSPAGSQAQVAQRGVKARPPGLAAFLYAAAVFILLVFGWQWLAMHREISDLSDRLARLDASIRADIEAAKREEASFGALSAKFAVVEDRLAETQNQRAALEELYNKVSAGRQDMVLADVEQLLALAQQQLQVGGNIRAGVAAMQQADRELQRLKGPAAANLRGALARDLERLRAASVADFGTIKAQLAALAIAVDSWPLVQETRVAQPTAEASSREQDTWHGKWNEFWAELRQTVQVENIQQPTPPLLPPSQRYFLRENLKLRLLSARVALMAHDSAAFRQELQLAQDWLAKYFDLKSAGVAEATATIRKLRDLSIEVPDISVSLQAVRNFRISQGG